MSEPLAEQVRALRLPSRIWGACEPWCFPLVGSAAFLATLEFALALRVFPVVVSSMGGALSNAAMLAGVYQLVALLVCPLALAFWHLLSRHSLAGSEACAASFALVLALVGTLPSVYFLSLTELDFPQTTRALWWLSHAASGGAAFVFYFTSRRVFRSLEVRFKPGRMLGLWFLVNAGACLLLAHLVFAPVHLSSLAAAWGVLACLLSLLGFRCLAIDKIRWLTRAAILGGVLLFLAPPTASPETRYFQYTGASTVAPISAFARRVFDRDDDGAAGEIWGGEDCAPSDPKRGPGQIEIAGDGIDQDCSGTDAMPRAVTDQSGVQGSLTFAQCASKKDLSLLLVVIDAMRADALSENLMPNLSAFARRSVRYERAYSPSTMTRPSMGSIMTGLRVSELYRENVLRPGSPHFEKNLPGLLSEAGVKTMSVGWYPLDEASRSGFGSRNPLVVDVQPHKGQLLSAGVTATALSYLRQHERERFFVWAHYSDAHAPHVLTKQAQLGYPVGADSSYGRSLEYIDYHLGNLLRELERNGRLENTAVVITADHGEDRGDRGRLGHGPYLFEDATHVPLMVKVPGCAPRSIESPVSLSWLGATMANLTGVSLPGRLLPARPFSQTAPVVVEEPPRFKTGMKRALIWEQKKLVVDIQNGGRALFDLKADPGEERNVYERSQRDRARLESLYQAWVDEHALSPTEKGGRKTE